ncbi:peptidase U32 family protein [Candidatus Ruminimicrobiellum ovillum]|uniref:peptidase U32 family protein n=1 Tax=Candidatus Ruminimicrobiellum ovillum TaxID=1947927 RepID=UPI003559D90A
MSNIELLAPSGNTDSFLAAVSAGADAVYVGLKDFSARAKAKNFSYKQLNEICSYAHQKNVKIFVALNTLIKNSELKDVMKSLEQISLSQADAIIVQDLGVAYLSKKYFPDIKLHASTQLTIHNSYGAIQAKQMGFERAVLARELSFDEIKNIKNKSNIELEIFCHGALCFCVSGLCLFSSFIGGYSGNRGRCTQPCRRLWTVDGKKGYFLSPKDFQLADYIKQIKETGVTSLKIEGRLKSADYVAKTVKAYRLLIDSNETNYEQNLEQAKDLLSLDYARQKTTFNFNIKSEDIFEPQKSKNIGLYLGIVENKTDTIFSLNTKTDLLTGDTVRIVDNKKDRSVVLKIEISDKKDNGYKIQYKDLYLENGFEVYKIADAEQQRYGGIEERKDRNDKGEYTKITKSFNILSFQPLNKVSLPDLFIRINNVKWIPLLKNAKADTIIKLSKENLDIIKNFLSQKNINDLYFELPPYIEEQDIKVYENFINFAADKKYNKFFINNISQIYMFKDKKNLLYAGQYLYTLNNYSAEFLSEYKINAFVSSWEDDLFNIKDLSKNLKNNLIVYLSGFPEIVISKMKFVPDIRNKNIKSDKDEFKVVSNKDNIIIPKYPVNLLAFKNNLLKAGIKSFAIDLSYIDPNVNYLTQVIKVFNNNVYMSSANKFNFERKLK